MCLSAALLTSSVVLAAPVDDARLKTATVERANWLTYGRDYANQRFSPLNQINRSSIQQLAPRWIYQTGPLVVFALPKLA
jgi:glucose dehydrogenase